MNNTQINIGNVEAELVQLGSESKQTLIHLLRKMMLIRGAEERIGDLRRVGKIGGPVHLSIGQEAVPVGFAEHLHRGDHVFGAHRSHGHYLALEGASVYKLIAEILGKKEGLVGGRGGSMHLCHPEIGFAGSVPIVAGTVSLAVGAALKHKLSKDSCCSVAYLGDGACEEGVVHECLNVASLQGLPVVFVVENNMYSSHLHITERQPNPYLSRYADAHLMKSFQVDGNDVLAVKQVAYEAVSFAKGRLAPVLVEAFTYRQRGHVDWRDDVDVGIARSQDDLNYWKDRCPIKRLQEACVREHRLSHDEIREIALSVDRMVIEAEKNALDSEPAEPSSLANYLFDE